VLFWLRVDDLGESVGVFFLCVGQQQERGSMLLWIVGWQR